MNPCSCVPDCNDLEVPGVLRKGYFLVEGGSWIVVEKVGTSNNSKFTTEMWIGSDTFEIGDHYHVFSPDREEHGSSSGLCVENGGVDSTTRGLGHSIPGLGHSWVWEIAIAYIRVKYAFVTYICEFRGPLMLGREKYFGEGGIKAPMRIRLHFLQVPGCGVAKCTAAGDTWVAVDEEEEGKEEGGQQEESSSSDYYGEGCFTGEEEH
eukprot:1150275-Pelagomonas_calceolata.AAC.1